MRIVDAPSEGNHSHSRQKPPCSSFPLLPHTLLAGCAIPALIRKVSWALVLNNKRVKGASRGRQTHSQTHSPRLSFSAPGPIPEKRSSWCGSSIRLCSDLQGCLVAPPGGEHSTAPGQACSSKCLHPLPLPCSAAHPPLPSLTSTVY